LSAAVAGPEVARRFCPTTVIETSLLLHRNGVPGIVDVKGIEMFWRITLTELPEIWIVFELELPKIIKGATKRWDIWLPLQAVKRAPSMTVTGPTARLQVVGIVRNHNWEEYDPMIGFGRAREWMVSILDFSHCLIIAVEFLKSFHIMYDGWKNIIENIEYFRVLYDNARTTVNSRCRFKNSSLIEWRFWDI
jgi:hypothetical protein